MVATTIDEVIEALDEVVVRSLREGRRIGSSAALHGTVTAQVRHGLEVGFFDDAQRTEHLNVVFSNGFLDALTTTSRDTGRPAAGSSPSRLPSAGRRSSCSTCSWASTPVSTSTSGWQRPARRPAMSCPRSASRSHGLTVARREAWRVATELAVLPPAEQASPIRLRDEEVARLASVVLRPGWLRVGLLFVRSREGFEVALAEARGDVPAPTLAAVEDRVRDDRAS